MWAEERYKGHDELIDVWPAVRTWVPGAALVIAGDGDPCPRCGNPMQIREYAGLNEKQERRPSFYTRWFCCMNKACKTTLVMPVRYKVV